MTDPHDKAVENFRQNDITNFVMETIHGSVSDEPRTLQGEFPGSETRAMGHALEVVEMAEEAGLDAEREYIGEMDEFNAHRIDIHLNGGDEE